MSRAESLGLAVHLAALAGMSRITEIYVPAFAEDRRNAQWFGDGTIQKSSPILQGDATWTTPSRYARKLRRHMEAKVRAYAKLLVSLRKSYPDTFVSASGDGEAELNFGGVDTTVTPEEQEVADYSPFAVLEFRDWIGHTGLYAPGQLFEGQGLPEGGPAFQGDDGLARFNRSYGTTFTTWSLRYLVTSSGARGGASEPWAAGFFTVMPCRVIDTREPSGPTAGSPALLAGETRSVVLGGRCSVPENAAAVSANVTIATAAGSGDVRIVPGDYAQSPATTIIVRPGGARANNALLYLATDGLGTVSVRHDTSGPLHLVIDVNGFFQ